MDVIDILKDETFSGLIESLVIKIIIIDEDKTFDDKTVLEEKYNYNTEYLFKKYFYKDVAKIDIDKKKECLELWIRE